MFKVCKQASIRIKSQQTDDKNGKSSNASTQTDIVNSSDKEIQSLSMQDVSVQVNSERTLSSAKPNFNPTKLIEFLNHASDLTIKEINESIVIDENLKYIELMNRENEELACDFQYSSKDTSNQSINDLKSNENAPKLTIGHVIWSSNLNQLILGFSIREHVYWCAHSSRVEFCNLYQTSDKKPNRLKKIFEFEIKNCITQMINHPTQFTQVAVGTKAGTIEIIDRELKTSSGIGQEYSNPHKLEITYLVFKTSSPNQQGNSLQTTIYDELLTCSLDGRIVLWKIRHLDKLQPIKVFSLSKQLARHVELLGIKSACLSSEGDCLLIGCANFLLSALINKRTSNELDLDFEYEAHKGQIDSIEQCPSNRRLFLSNGKDGEIRMYEFNLRRPLLTIYSDNNEFNYKWIDRSINKLDSQFIVGILDKNLHLINLYKKDEKYFTTSLSYALNDTFSRLFINRCNQLALVLDDEVSLFDLNVLMY